MRIHNTLLKHWRPARHQQRGCWCRGAVVPEPHTAPAPATRSGSGRERRNASSREQARVTLSVGTRASSSDTEKAGKGAGSYVGRDEKGRRMFKGEGEEWGAGRARATERLPRYPTTGGERLDDRSHDARSKNEAVQGGTIVRKGQQARTGGGTFSANLLLSQGNTPCNTSRHATRLDTGS